MEEMAIGSARVGMFVGLECNKMDVKRITEIHVERGCTMNLQDRRS